MIRLIGLNIPFPNTIFSFLERNPKSYLTLAKRLLGIFALGDVADVALDHSVSVYLVNVAESNPMLSCPCESGVQNQT
jgi:hypothetical protein